jgi:hypothetical protein
MADKNKVKAIKLAKKKRNKSEKELLKEKCIELAKKIAKERAGYKCEKCYRTKEEGWQMHGAHVIPVWYAQTAADPNNILCLCAKCHSLGHDSAHDHPHQFVLWYEEKFPGKYEELWKKANLSGKVDWISVLDQLKELRQRIE